MESKRVLFTTRSFWSIAQPWNIPCTWLRTGHDIQREGHDLLLDLSFEPDTSFFWKINDKIPIHHRRGLATCYPPPLPTLARIVCQDFCWPEMFPLCQRCRIPTARSISMSDRWIDRTSSSMRWCSARALIYFISNWRRARVICEDPSPDARPVSQWS